MRGNPFERGATQAIVAALEPLCKDGEFTIWRGPFRWRRKTRAGEGADYTRPPDGETWLSNAYEGFGAATICEERNWELVLDFGHVAVVRQLEAD